MKHKRNSVIYNLAGMEHSMGLSLILGTWFVIGPSRMPPLSYEGKICSISQFLKYFRRITLKWSYLVMQHIFGTQVRQTQVPAQIQVQKCVT